MQVEKLADGPHFVALRDAVQNTSLVFPTGTFALKREDFVLYYGKGGPNDHVGRIDFLETNITALQRLALGCEPATFGRNKQDVLDESYRKAGKLDRANFATNFDPTRAGLLSVVAEKLLEGRSTRMRITLELYKLNVYGPGSFFKAHKDTPRGGNMLATLVVVFPTEHVGGALVLRHDGHEYKFDSAAALREAESSLTVAYASFFGDVEHEVGLVESGYRVTLTYNLYFHEDEGESMPKASESTDSMREYLCALEKTFRAALDDSQFLPDGGLVGFGLHHQYAGQLDPRHLKGCDAALYKVCQALSLAPELRVVYRDHADTYVLCDDYHELPDFMMECNAGTHLRYECGARELMGDVSRVTDPEGEVYIHWATAMKANSVEWKKENVAAYGNEAWIEDVYNCACLVVNIGKPGSRVKLDTL